jgi:hypothetical protein
MDISFLPNSTILNVDIAVKADANIVPMGMIRRRIVLKRSKNYSSSTLLIPFSGNFPLKELNFSLI